MSLIEQVEFPGPTSTMFERHPPAENIAGVLDEIYRRRVATFLVGRDIAKYELPEDPNETAMAGPAPAFLFGRLPVEELPAIRAPLLNCPSCALTATGLIGAVACMVMLPSWPWTLLTFTVGWLLATACVLFQLLWTTRKAVDSEALAS